MSRSGALVDRARVTIHTHSWLAPVRPPAQFAGRVYRYVRLRGLVRGLGSVVAELLRRDGLVRVDDPVVGELWLRLRTPDVAVASKILLEHEYELPLRTSPDVIVDAGAYIGISARWFATRYPDATILALEPDPANFELLERNVAHISRIRTLREALWNEDESVSLSFVEGNPTATQVGTAGGVSESVAATTVPTLMHRHGIDHIDLLKLDIEGAELELFMDGTETWLPSVGAIALEVHEDLRPGATAQILAACRDFRALELGRETLFLERYGPDGELVNEDEASPPQEK